MILQLLGLLAVKGSVLLTLFGFGFQATWQDVVYTANRPWLLCRSLLAMFVVMPVVAVTLSRQFDFRPQVEIALIALSISPVPPFLPQRERRAGGQASFSLGLMVIAALLSILVVPLAVAILARYFSRPLAMAPGVVAALVLKSALLPLLVGMAFRLALPRVGERIAATIASGAGFLLAAGLVGIVVGSLAILRAAIGEGTIAAMTMFVAIGLAVGHLLGGPQRAERIVVALSTACRHPGIAFAIIAANFPEIRAGAIVLLFLLVSAVICVPYIAWQRRLVSS